MLQKSSMWLTLEVFFLNPSKEHYLMDISRKIGIAHTSVKGYLRDFVGLGIVLERIDKKGKRKFPVYKANINDKSFKMHKMEYNFSSILESGIVDFLQTGPDGYFTGSDERQYCSPGINLQVGSLTKTHYGKIASEYHTSADNLDFVNGGQLSESLDKYLRILFILENNRTYMSLNPKCEPQLGKRGLYNLIGSRKLETFGKKETFTKLMIFWLLNYSDGNHSLLDIAKKAKAPFVDMKEIADLLELAKLLKIQK